MYSLFNWPYACYWVGQDANNNYKNVMQNRLESVSKAGQIIMQNAQNSATKNISFMQKQSQNVVDAMNEHIKAPEKTQEKVASAYGSFMQDMYNHLKEMNDIAMKCAKELIDLNQEGVSAVCELSKSAKPTAQS